MFVRWCFAAGVAASLVGFGGTALAQEADRQEANEAVLELVQTAESPPIDEESAPARGSSSRAYLQNFAGGYGPSAEASEVYGGEGAADADAASGLWLGVQLAQELPPALAHHLGETKGALVESVFPDSPAAEAGVEAYDLIVRLGDEPIESHAALVEAMKSVEEKPVDVIVLRGGEKRTISVTPRQRQAPAANVGKESEYGLGLYAVPHVRVLPALEGADARIVTRQMWNAYGGGSALPENVESLQVEWSRDGDQVVPKFEVTTVDGEVFKGSSKEDLDKLPEEIRILIPQPPGASRFAIRLDPAPHGVVALAPAQVQLHTPPAAVSPPAPVAPAPPQQVYPGWVDVYRYNAPGFVPPPHPQPTYRVAPPSTQLDDLQAEVRSLKNALQRIEKLLQKEE